MKITSWFISALALSLLLTAQTAHADFRKALEAYQNRDGATMLKEVKDAVDKKNDDGLILFLNAIQIDEQTSKKTSFNDNYQEKIDRSKMLTTFETILNEAQQQEIKSLLNDAAKKSTTDIEFRIRFIRLLSDKTKKLSPEDFAKKEEYLANRISLAAILQARKYSYSSSRAYALGYSKEREEYWITKAAELGDAEYSLLLALRYLNYPVDGISPTQEECQSLDNHILCFKKDETKGFYWLQKAIESSNQNSLNMRQTAYVVGSVLRAKFDSRTPDLHQAYLWYLFGLNSPNFGESTTSGGLNDNLFISELKSMHNSGELKVAAPMLDADWGDKEKRNGKLYLKHSAQLPQWLLDVKNKEKQNKPIFSYARKMQIFYKIDVYSDGKVWLQLNSLVSNGNRDMYMQVSPKKVQEFIKKLKHLGFDDWLLVNSNKVDASYWCDGFHPCRSDESSITLRQDVNEKTVYLGDDKNVPENYRDVQLEKKIAQVFTLVEQYFPTQKIRCTLGSSKNYNAECLANDENIIQLASSKGKIK